MSKALKRGYVAKKVLQKVDHSSPLRVNIPAGMATAKPPLGAQLGQRSINVANFCKEFNERTANIKTGIPLPCRVKVKPDGTYELVIHQPPATFFLKQAAGISKGKIPNEELAGKITFKHLYEIAVIKSQDPPLELLTLKDVCQMLVGIARTCGIVIVNTIDPVEYAEFMKQREENLQIFLAELQESKISKVLRGS
ncbi:39S ribosomal protein L11, mitochondrial [Habropoda laboriosa]|uniref:Large ribosomal subunit protein uL11m n=1 Tax=Habropoda laboriosa TaxID=597456 RepID=A0A0L7R738_9HYME|nr:PREDICTED: 39S ribosomal protein L11, mitochondrial [Habropoda laboriosa]KOC66649.1 39S ribosomal protein L11, mitochondrial [Habropoda laboriosa]